MIDGFTFTNGQGSYRANCTANKPVGAAIYVGSGSALTINNCRFIDNGFDRDIVWGSAVYAHRGSLRLADCDFVDNGLYTSDPNLGGSRSTLGVCGSGQALEAIRCTFIHNYAVYGAGAMAAGTAVARFTDCHFAQNEAAHGGGAKIRAEGVSTIEDCDFTNNESAFGAGLNLRVCNGDSLEDPIGSVRRCTFTGITAGFGGGFFSEVWFDYGYATALPTLTLADSIFTGNSAAACCNTGIYQSPCWKDGVGAPVVDLGAYEFQLATCPADFDGSGFVDTDDFEAFVHAFEAGC
ncbi:MAG: hypothetical protein IT435_10335 [Phycisphaerales bacterium]|nr:hypothetical protein [Phycisphaerales bacterium]